MPAASSIDSIVSATTSVVPRSGSITISPQAISAGQATGLAISHQLRLRLCGVASFWAAYRISASFAISEGWNWIGPAANQRRAPWTCTPKCGTSTSTSNAPEPSSSSWTSRSVSSSIPWRSRKYMIPSPKTTNTT